MIYLITCGQYEGYEIRRIMEGPDLDIVTIQKNFESIYKWQTKFDQHLILELIKDGLIENKTLADFGTKNLYKNDADGKPLIEYYISCDEYTDCFIKLLERDHGLKSVQSKEAHMDIL